MSVLHFAYSKAFQVSPILLRGGQFDYVPLASLFTLISGYDNWAFKPVTGADIFKVGVSELPSYDLSTAANNTTKEPLYFEYLLMLPANHFELQLPVMYAFQSILYQHRDNGGTFDCVMPAAFMDNCLLVSIKTADSMAETTQLQPALILSFMKPIISTSDVKDGYNKLMKKIATSSPLGAVIN
jgi:hypothetical protein